MTHLSNQYLRTAVVTANVLTGNVGKELLVSVTLSIQDQNHLLRLAPMPAVLESDKHTEFIWHVESGQLVGAEFSARQVMDAETGIADDSEQFLSPGFPRVVDFQGASDVESTGLDGEHQGAKQRAIF